MYKPMQWLFASDSAIEFLYHIQPVVQLGDQLTPLRD
jgi:hypothetical protein